MEPAVAAGHPATADAGAWALERGGSAADAAVAAVAASCVAETVMTGLLGGGPAIYWEASTGSVWNLDCLCARPSRVRGALPEVRAPFGEAPVHCAAGQAT